MRRYRFRFERLNTYHAAVRFSGLARRIAQAIPDSMADIREILNRHDFRMEVKIARGCVEISRRHARDTFRISRRSAECCESLMQRFQLAGIGEPQDVSDALAALAEAQAGLNEILARIDAGLPQREVFRGM